jgi:hypothetical protein
MPMCESVHIVTVRFFFFFAVELFVVVVECWCSFFFSLFFPPAC